MKTLDAVRPDLDRRPVPCQTSRSRCASRVRHRARVAPRCTRGAGAGARQQLRSAPLDPRLVCSVPHAGARRGDGQLRRVGPAGYPRGGNHRHIRLDRLGACDGRERRTGPERVRGRFSHLRASREARRYPSLRAMRIALAHIMHDIRPCTTTLFPSRYIA